MYTINELIKTTKGKLEDLNGAEFNFGSIKVRDSGGIKNDVLLTFEYMVDLASYANHVKFVQVINELMNQTTGKSEVFNSSYAMRISIVTLLVGKL